MSFLLDGNRELPLSIHIEKTDYDVEFFIDLFEFVSHFLTSPYVFLNTYRYYSGGDVFGGVACLAGSCGRINTT